MMAPDARLFPSRSVRLARRRRNLLMGCAVGAAAALNLQAQQARAQAFQGTYTPVAGNIGRTTGTGTETISIGTTPGGSATAIINWTDASTNFLPEGNLANFQGPAGFAVLNRIFGPGGANINAEFNGDVIGRLQDGSGPGGTIIFSSPGGILVGPTATFDVGSLVLTTLSVGTLAESGYGPYFDPNNLSFSLGTGDPGAAVVTQAGSTITASAAGSYVAMVAPRIVHGGTVDVNGTAAFVAAEAATMTINNGLFDIVVTTGSEDENGIVHTGTTGGPASTGAGDNHRIYMVAVPKNQAMTALLSGNIGFQPATDVTIENGAIVLSAGYGTVLGDSVVTAVASPGPASFDITGGSISSDLTGYAVTDAFASATSSSIQFDQDVSLFGGARARLSATGGQDVTVGGDAVVSAARGGNTTAGDPDYIGGEAIVQASGGGSIVVTGDLTVDANGTGGIGSGVYGAGTGGTARAIADGGAVEVGGDLEVRAAGFGASTSYSANDAGGGYGGEASIESRNSGSVVVTGNARATAGGLGGNVKYGTGATGTGIGGTVSMIADGGSILISGAGAGNVQLEADGSGGSYEGFGSSFGAAGTQGGLGRGGTVVVDAGAGGSIVIDGQTDIDASGFGGVGGNGETAGAGGLGEGGGVTITIADASVQIRALNIDALGYGGVGGRGLLDSFGNASIGGAGGAGLGGDVDIDVGAGGTLTLVDFGSSGLPGIAVTGGGGAGGAGSAYSTTGGDGGTGGSGTGGSIVVGTSGGAIRITGAGGLWAQADGSGGVGGAGGYAGSPAGPGGDGGAGGNGAGGDVAILVSGGGIQSPQTSVLAGGYGGTGGAAGTSSAPSGVEVPGAGGNGQGGNVRISVADGNGTTGSASLGATSLFASAFAGGGGQTAADVAGQVLIEDLGTVENDLRFASLSVSAFGGTPSPAGNAFDFVSNATRAIVDGFVSINAVGNIGFDATGTGGLLAGGSVLVSTDGSISFSHAGRPGGIATLQGADVTLEAGGAILGDPGSLVLASVGNASLAATTVDVGAVGAVGDVDIEAGTIAVDLAQAGGDVLLDATGDIGVLAAVAGDDFVANAGGAFTGGSVTANVGSDIVITSVGDLRLDDAEASALIDLTSTAGSVLSDGVLEAPQLNISSAADIALSNVFVVNDLVLTTTNGDISGGSFFSDGAITLFSSGSIDLGAANAGTNFGAFAVTAATLGAVTAVEDIFVDVEAGSISLADGRAESDIDLEASGDIFVDFAQAGDDFVADAGGTFTGETILATGLSIDDEFGYGSLQGVGNIVVTSAGDLSLGVGEGPGNIQLTSTAGDVLSASSLVAGGNLTASAALGMDLSSAQAGGSIALTASGGSFDAGNLVAAGGIVVSASGGATLGAAVSSANLVVTSGGAADIGTIVVAGDIFVSAGSIVLADGRAGSDVSLSASGDINVGFAQAGDDFEANAGGAFTGGAVVATGLGSDDEFGYGTLAGSGNIFVASVGDLRLDAGDAAATIQLASSGGDVLSAGDLVAGTDLTASAGGSILVTDADAGDIISLTAADAINADNLVAGGSILGTSGGDTVIASATSGGSILLDVAGAADLGVLDAVADIVVDPTTIDIDSATAGGDIFLEATGDINVGFARAGDDFEADAGGAFTGGTVVATGLGTDDDSGGPLLGAGNIVVRSASDLRLDTGDAFAAIQLDSISGSILSDAALEAGTDITANAAVGIDVADADAGDAINLIASAGPLDAGNLVAGGNILVISGETATVAGADSGASLFVSAAGAADLGIIDAAADIDVSAASIILDDGRAGSDVTLSAGGDILVGFAQAGDDFEANAGGVFTGETVIVTGLGSDDEFGYGTLVGSGNLFVTAAGDLRLDDGDAFAAIRLLSTGGSILSDGALAAGAGLTADAALGMDINDAEAGTGVLLFAAAGPLDAGNLVAGGNIVVDSGGAATVAGADAGASVFVTAAGAADLGQLAATGDIGVSAASIILDDGRAGSDVTLAAGGDISVGFAEAGDDFEANAGGAFTGGTVIVTGLGSDDEFGYGTLVGSGNLFVTAAGNLRLDDGDAFATIQLVSSGGSILSAGTLAAGTGLTADAALGMDINDAEAGDQITLVASAGPLDAGDLVAGGDILVSSGSAAVIAGADSEANVFVTAGGAANLGQLVAAGDIDVSAARITLADGRAGSDVSLSAEGDISVGFAQAGDDFFASAGGGFTGTTVVATGVGSDDEAGYGALGGAGNIVIDAANDLRLDNGDAFAAIQLDSSAGDILSDGTLRARTSLVADAAQGMDINDAFAGSTMTLLSETGPLNAGNLEAAGNIVVDSGGDVTLGGADAGASLFVSADGGADLGQVAAAEDIEVSAASIILAGGRAGSDMRLGAGGDIAVGLAEAGDDFEANAGGAFAAGTVNATGLGSDDEAGYGALAGAGNILIAAAGDLRLDAGSAAGAVRLASSEGNVLSDGALAAGTEIEAEAGLGIDIDDAEAQGTIQLTAQGGPLDAGDVLAGDAILISAGGAATVASAETGASLVVDAAGAADLGVIAAADDLIVSAASIALAGGTAGRDIRLDAEGGITVGSARAGDDFAAFAGGAFQGDDLVATGAGGDSEEGYGSLGGAGNILIEAGGDLGVGNADAGRDIVLVSSGGGVSVDGQADAVGLFQANAAGDFAAGPGSAIVAGTVTVEAGGDGDFNDVTAQTVAIDLGGDARFTGAVTATTIDIVSADIDLAAGSALGSAATQLVELGIVGNGESVLLGGDAQGGGYTLTNAEAGRISGATLRIQAPVTGTAANRNPDVVVRDLALTGERIGQLELATDGIVEVRGNLALTNVRSDGGIAITANQRLAVVTPEGSIRVLGAGGLPAGTLRLASNNIWSGNRSLLDRLLADPGFSGRDQALLVNDGPNQPRGYIEGGDVEMEVGQTLFVQNSGTSRLFAGITVVGNTLTVTPTGSTPLIVYGFGRRINPDGSFVTNGDFFFEVAFEQGAAGYTDASEFNRCIINTRTCAEIAPDIPDLPGGSDIIEEPLESGDPIDVLAPDVERELIDTSFASEPLIDEPVTSGADSILWECDVDNDGDCDAEDRNG